MFFHLFLTFLHLTHTYFCSFPPICLHCIMYVHEIFLDIYLRPPSWCLQVCLCFMFRLWMIFCTAHSSTSISDYNVYSYCLIASNVSFHVALKYIQYNQQQNFGGKNTTLLFAISVLFTDCFSSFCLGIESPFCKAFFRFSNSLHLASIVTSFFVLLLLLLQRSVLNISSDIIFIIVGIQ